MKTFFVIIQALILLNLPGFVRADTAKKSKLSTDIRFDGTTVNGKRHAPFGMTTTVEDEKNTPSLIDYRSNFNDRVARSKTGR